MDAFVSSTHFRTVLSTRQRSEVSVCRRRPPAHRRPPPACTARSASAYDPEFDAASSSSNPPPRPPKTSQWEQVGSCDVLLPVDGRPCAIMLFIGGLGAGMSPPTFYGNLLRRISDAGNVGIIAARLPAIPSTDHLQLARMATRQISDTLSTLGSNTTDIPLIGMGHSLGSKILLLSCTDSEARRNIQSVNACIFMSFNNSKLRQALPDISGAAGGIGTLIDGLISSTDRIPGMSIARDTIDSVMRTVKDTINSQQDFSPDPQATLALAGARYPIKNNLIVNFYDDEIDDGADLSTILKSRFGQQSNAVVMQRSLPGTHLTPVAPDFSNSSFASLGNANLDETVRRAGLGVTKEVDATVAVIVAFTRLYLQTNHSK